jgi:hypothetical protein
MANSKFNPDNCELCTQTEKPSPCVLPSSVIKNIIGLDMSHDATFNLVFDAHSAYAIPNASMETKRPTPQGPSSHKNSLTRANLLTLTQKSNSPTNSSLAKKTKHSLASTRTMHTAPSVTTDTMETTSYFDGSATSDTTTARSTRPPPYTFVDSPNSSTSRASTILSSQNTSTRPRDHITLPLMKRKYNRQSPFRITIPQIFNKYCHSTLDITTLVETYCHEDYDYSEISPSSQQTYHVDHLVNDISTAICEIESLIYFAPRNPDQTINRSHKQRLEKSVNHHDLYKSTPLSFILLGIANYSNTTDFTNHVVNHHNYQEFITLSNPSLKHLCFLQFLKEHAYTLSHNAHDAESTLWTYIEITLTVLLNKSESPSKLLASLQISLNTKQCNHLAFSLRD